MSRVRQTIGRASPMRLQSATARVAFVMKEGAIVVSKRL